MAWGVFSWHCLGSLVRVPTFLSAIRYVELLGDHHHPLMLFCYPHGNGVLQQDNCDTHKSRLATSWLNLWDVLEQGVKGHYTAPINLTKLWTALGNICIKLKTAAQPSRDLAAVSGRRISRQAVYIRLAETVLYAQFPIWCVLLTISRRKDRILWR
ncbi:transposable element Tcb2 transposase [Trichonephila clavipes]|nr:transposable element Tcb2 transposase [Trichonephila clavipes]